MKLKISKKNKAFFKKISKLASTLAFIATCITLVLKPDLYKNISRTIFPTDTTPEPSVLVGPRQKFKRLLILVVKVDYLDLRNNVHYREYLYLSDLMKAIGCEVTPTSNPFYLQQPYLICQERIYKKNKLPLTDFEKYKYTLKTHRIFLLEFNRMIKEISFKSYAQPRSMKVCATAAGF